MAQRSLSHGAMVSERIVVTGASAGGIRAMQELAASLAAQFYMLVVGEVIRLSRGPKEQYTRPIGCARKRSACARAAIPCAG